MWQILNKIKLTNQILVIKVRKQSGNFIECPTFDSFLTLHKKRQLTKWYFIDWQNGTMLHRSDIPLPWKPPKLPCLISIRRSLFSTREATLSLSWRAIDWRRLGSVLCITTDCVGSSSDACVTQQYIKVKRYTTNALHINYMISRKFSSFSHFYFCYQYISG